MNNLFLYSCFPYKLFLIYKWSIYNWFGIYGGLRNIYETRQNMNQATNVLLQTAKQIDIAAYGLRGLINFQGRTIRKRINNGLKMKILPPSPESSFVNQREKDENCIIWRDKEINRKFDKMG